MADPSTPSTGGRRSVIVPATVAVVALLVTVVAFVASRPSPTAPAPGGAAAASSVTSSTPSAEPSTTDPVIEMLKGLARRTPGDPLALGRPDAPVVLISYSEFQCPFCGKFARYTEPTLIRTYVDAGVLRIEWRDFPYLGDESTTAAVAGRAAAAQGRFWQFHDALYADQQPPNSGRLTTDFLVGIARKAGLDTTRFTADLGDPTLRDAVEKDFMEGQRIGVTGTPAFLVNGTPIIGAQPLDVFERIIEQARAAAS
jgi:protein-disulfide isomerase